MTIEREECDAIIAEIGAVCDRHREWETSVADHEHPKLKESAWKREVVAATRLLSRFDDNWSRLREIRGEVGRVHGLLVKRLGIGFKPPGVTAERKTIRSLPAGRVGPCPLTEQEESSLRTAFGVIERELEKLVDESAAEPEKTCELQDVGGSEDKPSAGIDTATEPALRKMPACVRQAGESIEWLEDNHPGLTPTDPGRWYCKKQWEYLNEHGCPAYGPDDVPSYGTWTRNLRWYANYNRQESEAVTT